MRINRKILLTAVLFVVGLGLLAACTSPSSAPAGVAATPIPAATPTTAALDGAALLSTRCTTCHNIDGFSQRKGTRDQWNQLVVDMIRRGAKLNGAEKTTLVDYLAKTYGQ